jgi:hypothetical protein
MHRPGFRVTDAPPSDELQSAREAYLQDLTTAWRRGGKEVAVPDAPRVVGNGAESVLDIETAYRLYAEEIFPGIEDAAMSVRHPGIWPPIAGG